MTSLHPDYYDFDLFKALFEAEIQLKLHPLMPQISWDMFAPKGQSIFKHVGRVDIRVLFPQIRKTPLFLKSW